MSTSNTPGCESGLGSGFNRRPTCRGATGPMLFRDPDGNLVNMFAVKRSSPANG